MQNILDAIQSPDATTEDFASLGMTVTGMPALHSIRAVHEARPGIVTSADLPLRAFAGRFKHQSQRQP